MGNLLGPAVETKGGANYEFRSSAIAVVGPRTRDNQMEAGR